MFIKGDENARDCVTSNELAGTVHGAVELRFTRDIFTTFARRRFVDESRIQIGIDRHLLAGHGIQRETSRHLGDATGTLRDDDELNDYDDHEDDETEYEVATDYHVAESGDEPSCVGLAENQTGGRDVQRQTCQGENQQ